MADPVKSFLLKNLVCVILKKFIATCFHQYFFIISALVLDSQKVLIFLTLESIMAFVFLKIQLFCQ